MTFQLGKKFKKNWQQKVKNIFAKLIITVYGAEREALIFYECFPKKSLCIKGVQNMAHNKSEDIKQYQRISVQLSAAVVAGIISEYYETLVDQ